MSDPLLLSSLLIGLLCWALLIKIWRDLTLLKSSLGGVFRHAQDGTIQDILQDLQTTQKEKQAQIAQINETLKTYQKSLQNISIIRFNPFGDVGGAESFAIALLDQHYSGIVLSSLHAREGTRIYAKPIRQGRCPYELREEEREVLRRAMTEAPA